MVRYFSELMSVDSMVKDLRERGADPSNELSDDFLVCESHTLEEWEDVCIHELRNELRAKLDRTNQYLNHKEALLEQDYDALEYIYFNINLLKQ